MRMTNIQENNNNYDNNNNNNNNPKPTSRIPSLQHSREPPQKMNYSLFDFVIFFFYLFFQTSSIRHESFAFTLSASLGYIW